MNRQWTVRAGVLAASVGLVLSPAAASAQTTHEHDPAGDAPAAGDVTKVVLKHKQQVVRVVLTIPEVKPKKLAVSTAQIKAIGKKRHYLAEVVRNRRGTVKATALLWAGKDPSTVKVLPCAGLSTGIDGAKVSVTVPTSCLTKTAPGARLKAKGLTLVRVGPAHDAWDEVTRYTPLAARG